MENNNNNSNNTKNESKMWPKLLVIFLLSVLLLIPQSLIRNLIGERQNTEQEANIEVCEKWGENRTVCGPAIFIPGDKPENNLYILPETLDVEGNMATHTLSRGIFDFSVYEVPLHISGKFVLPKEVTAQQLSHLQTNRAKLLFSINDFKGFVDYPTLTYQGNTIELNADGFKLGNHDALSSQINIETLLNGGNSPFDLQLTLKGSNTIDFVPVGRTTNIDITSDCPTPSFNGRYLPNQREVTKNGFHAQWKVLGLNRDFPQVLHNQKEISSSPWVTETNDGCIGTASVNLKVPVEQYQQTTRTIKYAYLIILLTFAVVFFVENRHKKPIHPVQYALVGLALILFYTLLLSFSEHIAFWLSYLIAALMTIGLITAFIHGILKHREATLAVGGLLATLYLFIYIIMQLESYALLVGSIGIFIILAVAMYASRKLFG